MIKIMDFYNIIEIITTAITEGKKVDVYYPKTENREEGWRTILPKNITTDIPPEGEELVLRKDRMSPGHILNAEDVEENNKEKSFIIGKIKQVRFSKK